MAASSRRFEDLKDELIALKEKIRIHLRRNANDITISKLFTDGDNLVEQIRIEVEKCPSSVITEMNNRFFSVRNEWTAFKSTARRPALLSSGGFPASGPSGSRSSVPMTATAALTHGIESLERTSQSLYRAEMAARESEEIGTAVMGELGSQREVLLRTQERLDTTNAELKKSHRLIRMINTQVITNKCLLIFIILLEIMVLVAIVYIRFLHKH